MSAAANTIDEYLAAVPAAHQAALAKICNAVKLAAPEAVESISYGIPTFKDKKRPLIYFGAAKNHCALYGMSVMGAHAADLAPYYRSKGTVRFPPEKPLPASLVKNLVKAQVKEIDGGAGGYKKK